MPEAALEFRATDGGWYAGTATFEGPFLRVHFEHFSDEDDEKWMPTKFQTTEDAKRMIRPASQPMQDYHCGSLLRGVFLCVACRQPPSECFEYYDAKLQQIQRSPHTFDIDGQECCMCKFEVEWLGGPLVQKRQFVTCGDICLRTHGHIEDDPVIKEYLAEVNRCKVTKRDCSSEKDALSAPQKRKALSSPDKSRDHANSENCQQSVSNNYLTDLDACPPCGEKSNQTRDQSVKVSIEEQSVQKSCSSSLHMKSSEPGIISRIVSELNQPAKRPMNVIEIDSDKEEDCKPSSGSNHIQTSAIDDVSTHKSVPGFDCSKKIPKEASPVLDDRCSNHCEFSANSEEQMFSCSRDAPACSCAPWRRHCHMGGTCQYEAMGFVPITPFDVTCVCTHSMHSHRKVNPASNWAGSVNLCTHSATSQVCSQSAGFPARMQEYERSCDDIKSTSRCHKGSSKDWFLETGKGLTRTQFLLVENIEKDVIPSEALRVIRRITCDALMIYIWPTLDYERTRKAYICYQDYEAAEAAFERISAENVFIASSKGRPWVISKPHLQELDWSQMCSISASLAQKQVEAKEETKEAECEGFVILYKGTEGYTVARGRHKLFVEQQKNLQLYFQLFMINDEELETRK